MPVAGPGAPRLLSKPLARKLFTMDPPPGARGGCGSFGTVGVPLIILKYIYKLIKLSSI